MSSDSQHHGLLGFFEDHWGLLLGGIIIIIIFISLAGLLSPITRLVGDTVGLADAIIAAIEEQFKICFSSWGNFFNPGSGCFMGIFMVGSTVLWVGFKALASYKASQNALVEQAKFETGKSGSDLARELIRELRSISDDQIKESYQKTGISDPTKAQIDAVKGVIINNSLAQQTKQAIDSSSMNPSEKQAATANLIEANKTANAEVIAQREIPPEESRDVEKAAEDFEEPVIK